MENPSTLLVSLGSLEFFFFFFSFKKYNCLLPLTCKWDENRHSNSECCMVMNSSCKCLLRMRFQAKMKQWLYFMLKRLSAYLWGIAAGFDSVMCVKPVERTLIFLHSTTRCILTLRIECAFFPPTKIFLLSIYGYFLQMYYQ